MTIGAWIFFAITSLIILIFSIAIALDSNNPFKSAMSILIALILIGGLFIGLRWYYQNTESGGRALKTQDSNLKGGITRQVDVYDMDGELIKTYKGKFDVEWLDDRILFDDENGLRHVIYFTTGTVVVDEITNDKEVTTNGND